MSNIDGSLLIGGLSIHPSTDQDWFKFTLEKDAVTGQVVRIDFNNAEGNLQLELFDADGNSLGKSNTNKNFEEISLAGKSAGTYYVKVTGVDEAENPEYSLTVDGTPQASPDALEPNDSPGEAFELKELVQTADKSRTNEAIFSPGIYGSPGASSYGLPVGRPDGVDLSCGAALGIFYSGVAPGGPTGELLKQAFCQSGNNNQSNYFPNDFPFFPADSLFVGSANGSVTSELIGLQQQVPGFYDPFMEQQWQYIFGPFAQNNISAASGLANIASSTGALAGIAPVLSGFESGLAQILGSGSPTDSFSYYPFNQTYDPFSYPSYGYFPYRPSGRNIDNQNLSIIPNLSIDTDTDQDWFNFELSSDGEAGQFISIDFDNDQGDLQLELFEAFPTDTPEADYQQYLVELADGDGDTEQISLAGLAKGEYYIRVSGEVNPNYSLTLSAPPSGDDTDTGDFTEPNNDSTSAYDLKEVEGSNVLS
jgi:hypothetical protein